MVADGSSDEEEEEEEGEEGDGGGEAARPRPHRTGHAAGAAFWRGTGVGTEAKSVGRDPYVVFQNPQ